MITTNWSISQLFISNRVITIFDNGQAITKITLPSVREVYFDRYLALFYTLMEPSTILTLEDALNMSTSFEVVQNLITNPLYTNTKEFSMIHLTLVNFCTQYLEGFNIDNRILYVNKTPITTEIWDAILDVMWQGSGKKETKVPVFKTEAAKKLYQQQLAAEAKIAKMRSKDSQDDNGLMKVCLLITYTFPSYTVDALLDLTMAQLLYLQTYAARACAYETESNAYANGNLKKPPKFFLE